MTSNRAARRPLLALAVAGTLAPPLAVADSPRRDAPKRESGRILWSEDLTAGDLRSYKIEACDQDRVRVVRDPRGLDRNVLKLTVRNTDVAPCTPTRNPRAQASSPALLREGGEYWIGWSVLVPRRFPTAQRSGDNWISLGSIYGSPFGGNGSNGMKMDTSPRVNRFYYRRGAEYRFDQPWQMPLVRDRWVDFVFHIRLSTSRSRGFREQWVNVGTGWRRSLLHGRKHLTMRTLTSANAGGPNHSKVSLYYRRGLFDVASLYFAAHKIGTSFDAVAPRSHAAQGGAG